MILLIDDAIDVSFLYDLSEEEEEENKSNEKNKEFEVIVLSLTPVCESCFTPENEENLSYCFKKYPKPHLNLIFPPPEFNIS